MSEKTYLIISGEGDVKELLESNGFTVDSCTTSSHSGRNAIDRANDQISIVWSVEDVYSTAESHFAEPIELTEDEAMEILDRLDRRHDANHGICWDTIACHISMIKE